MARTMHGLCLTPSELYENPELAPLRILMTSLNVPDLALLATYPDSGEPSSAERCRTAPAAYAMAISCQIKALKTLLDLYVESLHQLAEARHRAACDQDVSF